MKPELFMSGETGAIESIGSNKVQIALMPLAYEDAHPGEHVDMADPDEKRRVVGEWLEQHAVLYRDFSDTHIGETIDLSDDEAVHHLWERIKEETVH